MSLRPTPGGGVDLEWFGFHSLDKHSSDICPRICWNAGPYPRLFRWKDGGSRSGVLTRMRRFNEATRPGAEILAPVHAFLESADQHFVEARRCGENRRAGQVADGVARDRFVIEFQEDASRRRDYRGQHNDRRNDRSRAFDEMEGVVGFHLVSGLDFLSADSNHGPANANRKKTTGLRRPE